MRRITFWDRVRYRFDTLMSQGTIAQIALLGLITLIFITGTAAVIAVTGVASADDTPGPDFFRLVWMGLMRTLDAGTMGGDDGAPPFLGAMLLITLGGVFVVSTLIGILTNGVEAKIDELRKGRSFVVEENHTLILGWSPQVFTLISEIVEANANQKNQCIVILADKDKIEMEDEIRAKVANTKTTRIVCRTGNPLDLTDLEIANPHAARSIIVVAPPVDDPDTYVLKTMLALTNNPNRKPGKYHIVAEIQQPKNFEVARMVGRDETQVVLIGDLISRITVQTCRQSGLSVVYTELLNFGGDEIYFKTEPALAGKTFGEALLAYADSTVIGLRTPAGARVNPPMDTHLAAGDQIIAIAADDDRLKISGAPGIDESAMQPKRAGAPAPERTLILGWNQRAPAILRELDNYVAPGSQTRVVANLADFEQRAVETIHQSVMFKEADTTDRQVLEALDVKTFNHIIVLSYSDEMDVQRADAQTLITLLHLRDMSERAEKDFSIVSEMLDVRNRELAEVTRADDFIVSDQLVSLLMAQVSENAELYAVFADLFDPAGSEIYLKPASDYVRLATPVNFYTVVESARRRGETAMGYRLKRAAHDHAKAYGVVVNPVKSDSITFAEGDKIIMLAES